MWKTFCEAEESVFTLVPCVLETLLKVPTRACLDRLCNPTSAPSWVIFPVIWLASGVKAVFRDSRSASQLSVRGKKALSKHISSHSSPPSPPSAATLPLDSGHKHRRPVLRFHQRPTQFSSFRCYRTAIDSFDKWSFFFLFYWKKMTLLLHPGKYFVSSVCAVNFV